MTSCPSCKAPLTEGAEICLECGELLDLAPIVAPPPPTPAKPAVEKHAVKRRVEEPEPMRCGGCGGRTFAARCPGCGNVMRRSDD